MSTPERDLQRSHSEALSPTIRHWFQGWVEQHIIADDPYDDPHVEPPARENSGPFEVSFVLALLTSGTLSIIGLISLWRALVG